ncbi:MAG: hypothetical protein ACKVXR_17555 [Planctomycetota bacterium]
MRHFVILALLLLPGCSLVYSYGFSPEPADAEPIDHYEPGLCRIKYMAYRGDHRLGGTLKEIAIRNESGDELVVESISLVQLFRGEDVTKKSAPVRYVGGDVFTGRITESSVIASGQWMYFVFPTRDITFFRVGERMNAVFAVSLRAGPRIYEARESFSETITRDLLPMP